MYRVDIEWIHEQSGATTVGSQTELAGSMLSGFVVLHRSSSDVGNEQEGARECFLPSSFFFFLDSGVLSSQKFQILAYLLFLSLFLHLFSHSHWSRFPRRHVTDTGRRHSRNRSSTRYFQKINRLTQREENIVRLKCGYLVIPRPHVVRLVISPSLLLSLFLFLYVFIVIN